MLNIEMPRYRGVMIAVLFKLRIEKWWQDPDLGSWSPKDLFENCQNTGIVLMIPVWLHSKLWRQNQESAIGAVIKGSALLDPGIDLLEKDLGILEKLIPSKEGSARDRVCQSSHDNNLTVLILAG